MKIYNMPRRSGKTTMLIKQSLENNYLILTGFKSQVESIQFIAREKFNGFKPMVMTIQQYMDGKARGLNYDGIVIDELDLTLVALFNRDTRSVIAATITTVD